MGTHATHLDVEADELVEQKRERVSRPLGGRELIASLFVGGAFFAAAVPMAIYAFSHRMPSVLTIVLLSLGYAIATQVEFEVGAGVAWPTQLMLVPMLFVAPVGAVPLLVLGGLVAGNAVRNIRRRIPLDRLAVRPANCWHAVGPALVLLAWGEAAPRWSDWPIYLAALAAQFLFDYLSAAAREWLAFGVSPKVHLKFAIWIWGVDLGLAPIGLLAAFASTTHRYAFLLVLPLAWLLALFARQRRVGIDHALELGHAYRGTAFLLGDVVEADDAYTGSHSRDVVTLVLGVSDALGLDANSRRDAEFAALLHDIGKIKVPKEIINKPGPLDEEEWAVMKRHTIEGERLLSQVGGLLGEVGHIVRGCHEHWDGGGYPDGAAAEEIPLLARIVACCDAFSAMTSDRPYRPAMSEEVALAELRAEAGAQFDPRVVSALIGVLEQRAPAGASSSSTIPS
jgi:HD-GYP domain-containing protein (c-di-GMP phosphodiesterase class II)